MELQAKQVLFSTQFYPNKDHGIAGSARLQLYRVLEAFLGGR
jgi:hypothetical protein